MKLIFTDTSAGRIYWRWSEYNQCWTKVFEPLRRADEIGA